jgi:phosphoribosylglycinamide formyltransferase-1
MKKIKLALFASGNGSNALNIIDYFSSSSLIEIGFVLTNKKDAPIIELAKNKGVDTVILSNDEVANGELLTKICIEQEIDFIILAGYLRKIPSELLANYSNKMINVHPALLPKFGGKGMYGKYVHQAVVDAVESETGITIHFVNEHFDEGRVIAQFYCDVTINDTAESVQAKVQQLEQAYFPFVIEKTILNQLIIIN